MQDLKADIFVLFMNKVEKNLSKSLSFKVICNVSEKCFKHPCLHIPKTKVPTPLVAIQMLLNCNIKVFTKGLFFQLKQKLMK